MAGTPRVAAGRAATRPSGEATKAARLPWTAFVQVLLEFQLAGHLQYLSGFVSAFRHLDPQQRGLVDEASFRKLVRHVEPHRTEPELQTMLQKVDPHNHQRITFSDCVCVLAAGVGRLARKQAQA